jgi:hypothetical protein
MKQFEAGAKLVLKVPKYLHASNGVESPLGQDVFGTAGTPGASRSLPQVPRVTSTRGLASPREAAPAGASHRPPAMDLAELIPRNPQCAFPSASTRGGASPREAAPAGASHRPPAMDLAEPIPRDPQCALPSTSTRGVASPREAAPAGVSAAAQHDLMRRVAQSSNISEAMACAKTCIIPALMLGGFQQQWRAMWGVLRSKFGPIRESQKKKEMTYTRSDGQLRTLATSLLMKAVCQQGGFSKVPSSPRVPCFTVIFSKDSQAFCSQGYSVASSKLSIMICSLPHVGVLRCNRIWQILCR